MTSNVFAVFGDSEFLRASRSKWMKIPAELREKYSDVHNLAVKIDCMYSAKCGNAVATALSKGNAANSVLALWSYLDGAYGRQEVERVSNKLKSIGWMMFIPKPMDLVLADANKFVSDMHKMNYAMEKEGLI